MNLTSLILSPSLIDEWNFSKTITTDLSRSAHFRYSLPWLWKKRILGILLSFSWYLSVGAVLRRAFSYGLPQFFKPSNARNELHNITNEYNWWGGHDFVLSKLASVRRGTSCSQNYIVQYSQDDCNSSNYVNCFKTCFECYVYLPERKQSFLILWVGNKM